MQTRRRYIAGLAAAGALTLAGCAGIGETSPNAPDPVALSGQRTDYQGGMVIGDHGGPNGQIFYAETDPQPRQGAGGDGDAPDNIAWFHTLVYGLFPYHFEMRDAGARATAVYVTDYSTVEWELSADSMIMPAPTDPETFADATELSYVAGSDARGGMGATLIPFAESDDAAEFSSNYNGRIVSYDEIDRELISSVRRR